MHLDNNSIELEDNSEIAYYENQAQLYWTKSVIRD